MIRSFRLLLPLLVLSIFTSCLDDKEAAPYTPPAPLIKNLVMGNIKRVVHSKTPQGKDSTWVTTLSAARFPLYIDQLNNRIYNPDSLPKGARTHRLVFASIIADGFVTLRKWNEEADSTFNISDSTNFSKPRTLRVYDEDEERYRDYRVDILVHREEADSTTWKKYPVAALAKISVGRTFATKDSLAVFGTEGGKPVMLAAATHHMTTWKKYALSPADFSPRSVQRMGTHYYALAGNQLLRSNNGRQWTALVANIQPQQLLMAGEERLIALRDHVLYGSIDGMNWEKEPIQLSEGMLPIGDISGAVQPLATDKKLVDYLLVGSVGKRMVTWKRTLDLTQRETYPWVYYPHLTGGQVKFNLPVLENISLMPYGTGSLAIGLQKGKPSQLYYSRDNGRVWRTDLIPTPALRGTSISGATSLTNGLIWLFLGGSGEVWCGRLHSVSWSHPQKVYTD